LKTDERRVQIIIEAAHAMPSLFREYYS